MNMSPVLLLMLVEQRQLCRCWWSWLLSEKWRVPSSLATWV